VTDLPEVTLDVVRAFLLAHGALLAPGDRVIAGSLITPLALAPGDDLVVTYGPLGTLQVAFN
jgi:2-keto-4-pentenoate hydratase